ncbi:hypothetical protein Dsin_000710 [Dipteronia sinensis]|uniref:Uncharacterized protein n=1 Tax=Dipteronia sinensis TaxID=43782 RepID=A0AAE0B465_9ROSI|nr:hypothetical protein Dsin_000710 [Dipteronia sinensis]
MKDCVDSFCNLFGQQSVKLPSEICIKPDKLNRGFLWGHTATRNAVHLIKWDNVCLPKRSGGLGIKKTKGMSQAILAKAGWKGIACGAKLIAKGIGVLKDLAIVRLTDDLMTQTVDCYTMNGDWHVH